jgi:DNA-binding MarR family transcriptional regulator
VSGRRDLEVLAGELRVSIGLLVRRLRQSDAPGELTMPETTALARLDRGGPTTASALAKQEQISPQSMGATLGGLEARGLIARSTDPEDGRRVVLSLTPAGRKVLGDRRNARVQALARGIAREFTPDEIERLRELATLLERLAEGL